jgi:predicted hydrocarbon binding protein
MPSLFEMFKFSKMLNVKDGDMSLMGVDINIIPTSIICELQKGLIESMGFTKAYDLLYSKAKEGSLDYNSKFIKQRKFTDKHKILDWQTKIVTFSGYGNLEIAQIDFTKENFRVKFNNSKLPKVFGKQKYPVDIIPTGFVAGGLSATLGKDVDALEIKCTARGDPFCEIEVGSPSYIKKRKVELWKKWNLK